MCENERGEEEVTHAKMNLKDKRTQRDKLLALKSTTQCSSEVSMCGVTQSA